ncbi:MAG: type II secretion system F family protein [Dehalococcoidia bacterium]|nr:type II secretion system F family protein [Dehalococcoidia bacterium]
MLVSVLVSVAVMAGVVAFFVGINRAITEGPEISDRLGQFAGRGKGAIRQVKSEKESVIGAKLDRAISTQNFAQNIARELARANLKLTVAEYLVLNALTTLLGAIVGYVGGGLLFGIVGIVAGFFSPRFFVRRRQKARLKAFNDQLGDTISLLANSLRSGFSLFQSMDMVAKESPEPASEEFRRVVREVALGLSPEEALANLVRRISSEDLDLMVTAINVQHEVGGNLSQILETIGHTIRERVRIKGEVETLTAQQQYAGYIVAALPVLLTLILFLLNPGYMTPMFRGIYLCMPIGGLVLIIIGYMVIRKIVDIKV